MLVEVAVVVLEFFTCGAGERFDDADAAYKDAFRRLFVLVADCRALLKGGPGL
jgi:hypothetical protein